MALIITTLICLTPGATAHAQVTAAPLDIGGSATVGGPETGRRVVLRFVTEGDFPPFNYLDQDGALAGFNIDLARAICLEANAACDIKVRAWEEQFSALSAGEADAAIASHRVTWRSVAKVEFSDRYLHTPGHFAGKRDGAGIETTPETMEGKTLGVARGTAHEAFLKEFFNSSRIVTYDTIDIAREAVADGKVQYLFDDAIGLSLWVNGTNSRQCCELKGGPFMEPKYFGDGIAIALPKGDPRLKTMIDQSLARVRDSGRFDEIVQRYFPARIN
ncbi:MAG: transporter substrate-binding domain-containing protein [Hyphomicrobiaceae bacterium]|nr:transporter substrate-binding domain-containing protein [Hyphomicrobiaceae bacterium]